MNPIRWLLCAATITLSACGGGAGPEGEPAGITLPGADASLALAALPSVGVQPAQPEDVVRGVLLTRLTVVLDPAATVGQINQASAAVGATGFALARPGSRYMTWAVPRQPDGATLSELARRLSAMPGITLATPGRGMAVAAPPPVAIDPTQIDHLLASRFPQAWNAQRLARSHCDASPVTVLMPDEFGATPPLNFGTKVPTFKLLGTGMADETHGYRVAATMAGAIDMLQPIGANPLPHCLRILGVNVIGLDPLQAVAAIAEAAITASKAGPIVVNLSLGFNAKRCGPAHDQPCTGPDLDPSDEALTTTLREEVALRFLSAAYWATYAMPAENVRRWLLVASAGNDRTPDLDEGVLGQVYPGFSDGRLGSPWALAARLDEFESLVTDAALWAPEQFPDLRPAALADHLRTAVRDVGLPFRADNLTIVGATYKLHDASDLQPADWSNTHADLMAVGSEIGSIIGGEERGTSFAAPQVAGLVSYLWLLDPELQRRPVADTLALIRSSAASSVTGDGTVVPGIIDAYAAVLALDHADGPMAVRRTLLDLTGDDQFDAADLALWGQYHGLDGTSVVPEPELPDYGRLDLNGDGFTGGRARWLAFDLAAAHPAPAGSTLAAGVEGTTTSFDPEEVTDLDALCYYAYSALYQGDTAARRRILGDRTCRPVSWRPQLPPTLTGPTPLEVSFQVGLGPATAGELWVTAIAPCGTVTPSMAPVGALGKFSATVTPGSNCGSSIEVEVSVSYADGVVAAVGKLTARVDMPIFAQVITGVGLQVREGRQVCLMGTPCTFVVESGGIALSNGAGGNAAAQSSLTICPGCGGPQEVWYHGLAPGAGIIAVHTGNVVKRLAVTVGRSGVSIGSPSDSSILALNHAKRFEIVLWVRLPDGRTSGFDIRSALPAAPLELGVRSVGSGSIAGASLTGTTAPSPRLTIPPGAGYLWLWAGSTPGDASVSLAGIDAATQFDAPAMALHVGI